MEKRFVPHEVEDKLYAFWEKKKYFEATVNSKKEPFCIVLPPPNANADLHLGHAMFVYEDIMIRYQKLQGKEVLWVPGFDHAGIETQFVFEKHLKKQGKSRFEYDRNTLYQMIWDFVEENKPRMRTQLKRLGLGLDWSKEVYSMDPKVVEIVYQTFQKLYDQGLLYRTKKLVNYSTAVGTSYSDYEVQYEDRTDPLYYMTYGPFTIATVRPETIFGDVAVAVHPDDKRYKKYIGTEVEVDFLIEKRAIPVIGDESVNPKFGTGALKVTPAHDFTDYEIAQRHNLPLKQIIGFDGRLNEHTGTYKGLKVAQARKQVAEDLEKAGLLQKVKEKYKHRVGICYKSGVVIEPLPKEQWFIKVKPLVEEGKKLIQEEGITIYPKRFKKQMMYMLDNFIDWNVSRQNVWGIQIPAFYQKSTQQWHVIANKTKRETIQNDPDYEQDPDTFDTWFSSSHWPFVTLMVQKDPKLFDFFYPTTVMETGYDILRAWVSRMIMIGYFRTENVPFRTIVPHGMLRDKNGQKMSKSKGNVMNPVEMIEKYGTDPLRAAFIFGTKEGNDTVLSEEKIIGMRNFGNKIWNIGRLLYMNKANLDQSDSKKKEELPKETEKIIKKMEKEHASMTKKYHKAMEKYRFSVALEGVYHFLWHSVADVYIEQLKDELRNGNIRVLESLVTIYQECLVLIHPFMPFVTDAVWQVFNGEDTSILDNNTNY